MHVGHHIDYCAFGLVVSVEIGDLGFYILADAFSSGDK